MFALATGAGLGMLSVAGGVLLVVALLLCAHSKKKSANLQEPDIESDAINENQGEAVKLIDAPSSPKTPNGNSPKMVDSSLPEADRNFSRQSKNQRSHTNVTTRQSAKKPEKVKDPPPRRPMSEQVLSPPFTGKLPMSTSERRLPAIPPPTGVPALVNPPDFDQTYDFIPEHGNIKDPNYQMIKDALDPNYQRVNAADAKKLKRTPDYEIVTGQDLVKNVETLKSDPATSEQLKVGEKKEDPYAKVKGDDPYAEVKSSDSKDKDYDDDYAEVRVFINDPYAKVNGSHTSGATVEGAIAAVVDIQDQKDYESVDETTVINGPGNHSPRPVDHENQPERLAQPPLPRVHPEVLPMDVPVVGPGNRSEPPYTQVSARESLESIRERKERERRQNPSVYSSVDEESSADFDQLYEQVESVSTTSEVRPPALPPMSNRNSRVITPSDVITVPPQSCTLPATGISLQQHYEEINTEGLSQPPRQSTLPPISVESRDGMSMPVYAVVDKSKQKGGAKKSNQQQPDQHGATDFSYLYAKVEKNGKNKQKTGQGNATSENPFAGTGARPKVKGHSPRNSTGSSDGVLVKETGYQSIDECKDADDHSPNSSQNATHQSYQNKESVHLYEAVSEKDDKAPLKINTVPPRDMVHIESIKTPENFWRRKDHTYEAMADDEEGEMKITASKSSPSLKTSVRQSEHMYEEVRLEANSSRSAVLKMKSNTLNGDARDYRRQMEKEKSSKNNNKGEKKKAKKHGKEGKGKNKTDAKKQREKVQKHDYQNWPTRSPSM